jgi:hypothetical protein
LWVKAVIKDTELIDPMIKFAFLYWRETNHIILLYGTVGWPILPIASRRTSAPIIISDNCGTARDPAVHAIRKEPEKQEIKQPRATPAATTIGRARTCET